MLPVCQADVKKHYNELPPVTQTPDFRDLAMRWATIVL
jgi:hypothetical protein